MNLISTFRAFIASFGDLQITNSLENRIDFSTGGLNFVFISDEENHYFRIYLPRVESYESGQFEKLNQFNTSYKAGKAIVYKGTVWFVFEHFIQDYERDGSFIFPRALSVLKKMVEMWKKTD